MTFDLNDTIVALSSPVGVGARAVVRLSGPDALPVVLRVFTLPDAVTPTRRRLYSGGVRLTGVAAPLPADLLVFPAPRTFTGQPMTELHALSSPPLVELLIADLIAAGARAARPGEFTLRAFLGGKLDLTRAEATLDVLEASSRDALKKALDALAGGMARPLRQLRSDLLDLLADLEAGLDFSDGEDIAFVSRDDLLLRIGNGLATLSLLRKQLDGRAVSDRPFRVVLAGQPNAGKTSLFNALTGANALVSPEPGTTRDYLTRRLDLGGATCELIDTAGRRETSEEIEGQAQSLGREQAEEADLILFCAEPGAEPPPATPRTLIIATKCDLTTETPGGLATSAATGAGLPELRSLLLEKVRARQDAPAPSVSRCRAHVAACSERLRQVHQHVLFGEPPELTAFELRSALDELGALVGAVYTDDLLDRIFSRFCIGK